MQKTRLYNTTARDILSSSHPVHQEFIKWRKSHPHLENFPISRRQAARFLQQFPHYREVKKE